MTTAFGLSGGGSLGSVQAGLVLALAALNLLSAAPPETIPFPTDYREWVFLSSGLGMTYGPAGPADASGNPRFDNVFVTPRVQIVSSNRHLAG